MSEHPVIPKLNLKHQRGNALIIVLVIVVILAPIGFFMMDRMRQSAFETRRIYNSLVLEHAARAGIEAVFDQIRQGDFSSGPHRSTVTEGVGYRAYLDTTGIGLIGQKICQIYSKGEGDGGQALLIILTVEVYPQSSSFLLMPHSYYVIRQDVDIDSYSARASLLNSRESLQEIFVENLKAEGDLSPLNYESLLKKLRNDLPEGNLKEIFNAEILPELLAQKAGY
jgi:hypothetical protein